MISYWPSYRSKISCIGLRPSSSDFVLTQLQVQDQLYWPEAFIKCFHIDPVTGPRSAVLAGGLHQVISYWPSYRSKVSCIGLRPSSGDFIGPATGPRSAVLA